MWEQERPTRWTSTATASRERLTRGHPGYLSAAATTATRVPSGLPEGYLEGFANLYQGVEAIRCHIDGYSLQPSAYDFPTVHDGLRGMRFIEATVRSAAAGGSWMAL